MALLAALASLLHRTTHGEDLAVGSPVANRHRAEVEGLIGCFVNTLVLRIDLAGAPSFAALLGRVREILLEAQAHQDLPFERLVEELQPARSLNHTPLFQSVLVLHAPAPPLAAPDLAIEQLEVDSGTAKFDLTVTLTPRAGALSGYAEYSTDLFDAATVERLLRHFRVLLAGLVDDPQARPHDLPLLAPDELHQVLVAWNDTARAYPREATLGTLFAAQAARRPEAPALVSAAARLSYGELDRRANRLARLLRRRGVGPERGVALCLERSVEALVALLAIIKAGGVYVPLDPALPAERLAWLLADAGVAMAVTRSALLRGWEAAVPQVVCLDGAAEAAALAAESEQGLDDGAVADNLAYVMYTSGSTGTPKGVGVVHRAVMRLVRGNDLPRFAADDVVLHLAPLSFDASTLEIWGALLNGGRLVVLGPGVPTPAELGGELERHEVTALWLTAGLFHLMVEEAPAPLARVRQLLAGGDVLSPEHVRRLLRLLGEDGGRLINGYGPTENTTFTCCQPVGAGWRGASVPIGRPIANTRVYLLDRGYRPVPVGVAGDLYATGDGLARGYFGHPGSTAESFVPDPFGAAGSRMYRTGDIGRYLPGGAIEFLGRRDHQVKIRGFRVEPGEVESALAAHPTVRAAAVLALGEGAGRSLAAFVAQAGDAEVDPAELRAFLRARLPDFMVPGPIVALADLPLTPNGKVDRQALAALELAGGEEDYAPPRTPVEQTLVAIWQSVLGRERVGIRDDFFALGGHSMLAMQLVSQVRETFGLPDFSLRRLFQEPTIEQLGLVVTQTQAESADAFEVERLVAELQGLSPAEAAVLLQSED